MTDKEIKHFTSRNKATKIKKTYTIDGVRWSYYKTDKTTLHFRNGKRIDALTFDASVLSGHSKLTTLVFIYEILGDVVTLVYCNQTLESLTHEYTNRDGIRVVNTTKHFELKGEK